MKNKAGFYVKSAACCERLDDGAESLSFKCPESVARECGVEWHHGGSGIISFFPASDEEKQRVFEIRDGLKKRTIKSKAAAIRYLESTSGSLKIPYKLGKYGKFFDFWGDPDGYLSISPEDENLVDIKSLLNLSI